MEPKVSDVPPDITLVRWIYENLWLPAIVAAGGAIAWSWRYVLGTVFERIDEVERIAGSAIPASDFHRENERNVKNIHDLRDELGTALNNIHAKIDGNHRDVMSAIMNRNN